jgi:hypothetical protein
VELRQAVFVLGLEEGEGVNTGGIDATHGLHALEFAEPVEGEEGFIRADAHDAAATERGEMERKIGGQAGISMAGANKTDGTDGVGLEMAAEPLVEREKGRLHGFHEEAVVAAGGGKDFNKLALIERGRLLA